MVFYIQLTIRTNFATLLFSAVHVSFIIKMCASVCFVCVCRINKKVFKHAHDDIYGKRSMNTKQNKQQ